MCKRILEHLPGCLFRCEGFPPQCSHVALGWQLLQKSAAYKKHEDEKKRTYGQRVLEIEHGVFTRLYSQLGMGREAQTFYKRLADLLSLKRDVPYSTLMGWLRCKLPFAILRSAVMCIQRSRSSMHHVLGHSPRVLRGLCATGILTSSFISSRAMN